MASRNLLTTLLVSYNTQALLDPCLSALRLAMAELPAGASRIVVVDNASRDGSPEHLARIPDVTLIRSDRNLGFGRANNLALPQIDSDFLLLLNTDAFVQPDSLRLSIEHLQAHPDCGILGVRLVGRDGELQPSCRYEPTPWSRFLQRTGLRRRFPQVRMVDDMDWPHDQPRDCDWVPGCFYLIRREVLAQVGLFDPDYFLYMEEVDHCTRARANGWKVRFFPGTTVVHIGGESAKADASISRAGRQISALQVESELLYFRKHRGLVGAWQHLLLGLLTETMAVAGHLRRGDLAVGHRFSACRTLLASAWRTRMGARPVR